MTFYSKRPFDTYIYDELTKTFDTRSVETVISEVLEVNLQVYIIK